MPQGIMAALTSSYRARYGLAALSGLVYALAYPPLGWGWLVLPGLAGLLAALHGMQGAQARTIGFLHGLAAYGVGLSWMLHIFGGISIILWCILGGFVWLFAEMQGRAVRRGWCGWKLAGFTALNWGAWEFIRAELFPLKFPWMTVGLAIGPNAMLPWIGVYGVGAVVVLCVALTVTWRWRIGLPMLCALLLAVSFSRRLPEPDVNDPRAVTVGGLQLENVTLDDFLLGTRQMPADVRHVVWPEYAIPYDIQANERDWNLVQSLCRERDITLTLGTQLHGEPGGGWRNIALTLDSNGKLGLHNKVHTVHLFEDGKPGKTARPIQTKHGRIGTPVCFDCDFEEVVRQMTQDGTEMFIVPIMDAESWTARQHEQHAGLFRIRACENGRWMFVCATSGVSQVIDPNGQVHARLPVLTKGTLIGRIRAETGLTFYTRFGWLTPWCALGMAGACWLMLILKPVKKIEP